MDLQAVFDIGKKLEWGGLHPAQALALFFTMHIVAPPWLHIAREPCGNALHRNDAEPRSCAHACCTAATMPATTISCS